MKNAIGIMVTSERHIRTTPTVLANRIYGVETYMFSKSEISRYLKDGFINAYYWQGGEMQTVSVDFPKYLILDCDIEILEKKDKPTYDFLTNNTVLLDEGGLNKYFLQQAILKSELKEHGILTFAFTKYCDLLNLLNLTNDAIIKPMDGRLGIGVMKVRRDGEKVIFKTAQKEGVLTESEFNDYYDNVAQSENLLFEPRINILNDEGHAVDFRCLVALNGKAEWENVLTYARIGATGVASNITAGGMYGTALETLESLAPGKGKELLEKMNKLAIDAVKLVRENSKFPMCLEGVDICLERGTNKLFVIEVNKRPGMKLMGSWETAVTLAQYFKYILDGGEGISDGR